MRRFRSHFCGVLVVFAASCVRGPPPPVITSVTPTECSSFVDTPITIRGQNFYSRVQTLDLDNPEQSVIDSGFDARLVGERGVISLRDVVLVDGETLSAVVPGGAAPGVYALEVVDPGDNTADLDDALEVTVPPGTVTGGSCSVAADCTENPCVTVPQCVGGECVYGNPPIPGLTDGCDGADNDCDGLVDEDYSPDASCGVGWCRTTNTPSSCSAGVETVCTPGSPVSEVADDGVDQDCSGTDAVTCFVDTDLDGVGSGDTLVADDGECTDSGESSSGGDCDDSLETGAGCSSGCVMHFADQDSDGFGSALSAFGRETCIPPAGFVANSSDCADLPTADPACNGLSGELCNPGRAGADLCDGADNDCDGPVDENPDRVWYHDADNDGFTDLSDVQTTCADPDGAGSSWVSIPTANDCDDDPLVCGNACSPGETEIPSSNNCSDGYDNDCDSDVDDADAECSAARINLVATSEGGSLLSCTDQYCPGQTGCEVGYWLCSNIIDGDYSYGCTPVAYRASWSSDEPAGPFSEFELAFSGGQPAWVDEVIIQNTGADFCFTPGYYSTDFEVHGRVPGGGWFLIFSDRLEENETLQSFDVVALYGAAVQVDALRLRITAGRRTEYWLLGEFEAWGYLSP